MESGRVDKAEIDSVNFKLPPDPAFTEATLAAAQKPKKPLVPTDYTRVDSWIKRIRSSFDKGLNELYFFIHQHDERYSPRLCVYVIEQLNKHCGTDLERTDFLDGPQLF